MSSGLIHSALVIAPLRPVYDVWPTQIQQWNQFKHLKFEILHGPHKEHALRRKAQIYIINPDGLPWLLSKDLGKTRIKYINPDVLVIDESSKFKHVRTRRFKLLKPCLSMFKRRIILTGSPNPNGYIDLFGQIFILDQGAALGQYITHYRVNYFLPTGFGGHNWVLQKGADKAIQKRIKPLILRLDGDDYLKVPKEIVDVRRVDLPEDARRIYNELESDMLARINKMRVVTAVNAAVASMKCCQVANGGIYLTPDGVPGEVRYRETEYLHTAKTDELQDLVDELQGTPMLVGYWYDHDLENIRRALGRDVPALLGKPAVISSLIHKWNAGKLPVLLGHPASVAHGLNMQEGNCQHICFYNIPWDYELYDQLIRRLRRQGNKSAHVIVHLIAARNTVDEVKMRALKYKGATQKQLLDALRSYSRTRVAK